MNWGLFTAMRGISAGYEAFVGAEEAATVVGKGTALLLQFETATAATLGIEYAKRKAAGKELTRAEARNIVLESAAMFVGIAIAARLSKPMLEGLKLSGRTFGARLREINRQRAELRKAASALEKSGNIKKAPEVLDADAKLLDREQLLIKDLMRASNTAQTRAGGKLSQAEMAELAEIRSQNAAAQEGNARSRVMLKLEPAGGNTYLAPKGELNRSGGIADEYRTLGDEVTAGPKDPVTQSESIRVKPSNGAEPLRVVEKAGPAETTTAGGTAKSGGGCFVAGTVVLTKEGPRAIELMTVGDVVWAGDPVTGEQAPQRVSRTYLRNVSAVLDITLGEQVLTCTPGHPFWIPEVGWKEAGALATETVLLTRGGGCIAVGDVRERTGDFTVFNLEVDGFQTFFVGVAEVLVHNKAWELLPGLRPAQDRLVNIRAQIGRMSDRRAAARQALQERAQQVEARLAIWPNGRTPPAAFATSAP